MIIEPNQTNKMSRIFIAIMLIIVACGSTFGQGCGAPAYSSGNWAAYLKDDVVSYGGSDWIALLAGPAEVEYFNHAPGTDATVWALHSCGTAPTLTTTVESSVLEETASSGGNISAEGSSSVIARGVCWSTSTGPEITDSKTTDGSGTGSFTSNITGLTKETKYYFRAYATNSEETGYGAERWFYTGSAADMTTLTAIDIHCESFTSGITGITRGRDSRTYLETDALGDIFSVATEFGIIYGTDEDDVNDSSPGSLVGSSSQGTHLAHTASSLDQTERYLEITGVAASTTYYYKAYTSTALMTGYGSTKNFTTTAACPVFYSCDWDASQANRWSYNSDCSTNDGASITNNSICYHRNDWLTYEITDLDADVVAQIPRAMTALPYRLVLESGARVMQNTPTFVGGFQLDIGTNAQYANNGSLTFKVDGVAGAQGHIARLNNNDGSILVRGAYDNQIALTGGGEYCKTGTFTNLVSVPANLNGDAASPPSLPATRYVNGDCVGTAVLPIELVDFSVTKSDGKLIYKWVTGMELNNDYFVLETSYDGVNWTPISREDGAGNSNSVLYYVHVGEAYEYIKYVRLKQVDYDGTYSYSNIELVSGNTDISIYPNQNGFSISSGESSNVSVFSMGGDLVKQLELPRGYYEVVLSDLSAGLYFIVVNGQKFKIYVK